MKALVTDDNGAPLMVACRTCGNGTLDTVSATCARCRLAVLADDSLKASNEHAVTAAADAWLRQGRQ